ncbi:MAG: hypothetical protein H7835_17105 [Magnetococcus sp. XQGC-1]
MNTPFNRAYTVEALSLGDRIGLFSGANAPSTMDTSSFPVGSVYFQTDGTVWKRITPAADGWFNLTADMVGATLSAIGIHGLVPAPPVGGPAMYLRGDGNWVLLSDLANPDMVQFTAPWTGDFLQFNGTRWVNGQAPTGNAGLFGALCLFNTSPVILAKGTENGIQVGTLSKTPPVTGNTVITATSDAGAVVIGAWLSGAFIQRTTIPAGIWTISLAAAVDTVADGRISTIQRKIFDVRASGNTVTTTGSGTSRTITASTGGSFFVTDAHSESTLANYVQTPKGLYQVSGYISASEATIVVPEGYVNETAVAWSKWLSLFSSGSSAITSIAPNYTTATWDSLQPAFAASINATKLGMMDFAIANVPGSTVFSLVYDGTTDISPVSFVSTPMSANNVMTTVGDIIVQGVGSFPTRLPAGTSGQFLSSNGTASPPSWFSLSGAISGLLATNLSASIAVVSDAAGKIVSGAATSAELAYVSGVTSAIQTQLDGKQATITGAATSIVASNLTVSMALASDASGKVSAATATLAELNYLSGVTSAVQTQLDSKATKEILQNSRSAAYTLVLSDAGKHILHPSTDNVARTFTIPSNASVPFPIGTEIHFVNQVNTVTIAITADTLRLAGSASTGNRTLAANGVARAIKVAPTVWYISSLGGLT